MTPDIIYDQMIGMGCADRLVCSWGGNPGVGSLHRFRDAVEHHWPNKLELDEHGHAAMANAYAAGASGLPFAVFRGYAGVDLASINPRSEEHTSELQSLMRISYAVFCLTKKNHNHTETMHTRSHIDI